jgi:hypothetical protein
MAQVSYSGRCTASRGEKRLSGRRLWRDSYAKRPWPPFRSRPNVLLLFADGAAGFLATKALHWMFFRGRLDLCSTTRR